MFALSTWCRERSPVAFANRARALGVRTLAFEGTLPDDEALAILVAMQPTGTDVVAVTPPGGPRAPHLASEDKDERLAAVRQATTAMTRASELGARVLILELGTLDIRHDEAGVLRAFARRQLDPDRIARLVAERRLLSPRALDLCRYGLERLLEPAGALGVTVALANRPRWLDLPSAGELAGLLDDFRGAPLASWYDPAAAHVRRTLGFGNGRPAVEIEAAVGAWLTDAAGARVGLPWGSGDVDAEVLAKLPATALRVVHAAPFVTDEELALALTRS